MNPFRCAAFLLALAASAFGTEIPGLEVDLKAPALVHVSDGVSFTAVLKNKGSQDLLLNGGDLLGNGKEMWTALAAEIKGKAGGWRPFHLGWGQAGVAGRMLSLPLPLRAGATHELPVGAHDWFLDDTPRLRPGVYEIRAVFHQRHPSEDIMYLPYTPDGEARSSAVRVEVRPDPPKYFATWGLTGDPDGDCAFFEDKGSLLIHVPGRPSPHDLAAETGVTNAPRVLQKVKGDFAVQVLVEGRFSPGTESTLSGRAGYNGAGLVIMADPKNVVCLARAVFHHQGGGENHYANFEMRSGGSLQRIGLSGDHHLAKTAPVFLRLERRGSKVSGAVSRDGVQWDELAAKELPASWPQELEVGVAAISTSAEEFVPRFSRFELLR